MNQIENMTTYQYMVNLEDEVLANAKSLEEQISVLIHFRSVRDALYQRDWDSLNTAA
ncbi:hypothetical protein [Vibrio ponticus]|uniref:hypothetical protein n=1 Tax=Vibrio ponticus TaxID=265668 RepID=UPI001608CD8F|nr:hypothetical protein [Vibrio ponticus]